MLLHLCNYNLCFSFTSPKTHRNSSPHHRHPNLPFNPCFRRSTAISATEISNSTLPQSAIQRIAEKLRSLGYVEQDSNSTPPDLLPHPGSINSPGEIFVPLPTQLPKYRVGHTLDPSWSTPENPVPQPGSGNVIRNFPALRSEVLDEEKSRNGKREERLPSLAELKLPKEELNRLRTDGIALRKKLKIGKAGITEGIVNGIHERWRRTEVVKIVCEDICRLNMKRTHELLERKTGGLVVWRSGSNIVLYRGPDYKFPYFLSNDKQSSDISAEESSDSDMDRQTICDTNATLPVNNLSSHPPLIRGVGSPNIVRFQLPGEAQMVAEADALLEGLGPRFKDWWGYDPLPVDADLLPAVVTGYRRPFRLLPYGIKPKLTNDEMNVMRRLARPLPCHFALGRNRKLQGLAIAILKLWEKCEIAKIAIKRGVQNTNSELMAEELKSLTGGTLLSRDREYIVFYRGKDFLPATVSSAIERRRNIEMVMFENEKGKSISAANESKVDTSEQEYEAEDDEKNNGESQHHSEEKKLMKSVDAIERTSSRLSNALAKKSKAEKLLAELEKKQIPQPLVIDKEGITEEERYMLRKVGLRMKAFLLLGRRGIFDGTIENMHLHWKYRELVKVCIGNRSIEEVHEVARTLEAESGGILVAVERVSKGYAIIVYRGKNYKRPTSLRPRTLLSKREAMKRSLEAQRHKSLKLHVLMLNKNIEDLKLELAKDKDTNSIQLTEEAFSGFVAEKSDNIQHKDEKNLSRVNDNDSQDYVDDSDTDQTRERHLSDETSKNQVDIMHTTKDLEPRFLQESAKDVSRESSVKSGYLFNTSEKMLPEETTCFVNGKNRAGNNKFSYAHKPRDGQTHPVTSGIPHCGGSLNSVGHKTVESNISDQEATSDNLSSVPSKALQLSNKERLLLRKQALKMKNKPVLAVGKSNSVTGIAKAIKAHFLKHPLAIVSIKGRAEGTSIREVIYNLEQATGSILISQEPSKVILYRGWQSGPEHDQDSSIYVSKDSENGPISGKINSVAPALISAIRLEMGLETDNEEYVSSETAFDGNEDD